MSVSVCAAEVESYLDAQRVHRRPRGVQCYAYTLRALAEHAGDRPLDAEVVASWFVTRAGRSPKTILAEMSAIGSFDAWRRKRQPDAPALLDLVDRPRKTQGDTIKAPACQITRLAAWIESPDAIPRTARFAGLCLYEGLRREEARLLTWEAVDEEAMTITVIAETAKNGKGRALPIAQPMARLLAAVPRSKRVGAVAGRLDGGVMSVGAVAHIFDRELPRYGITLSAHMLRRAFATRLDELGVSARVIQELLGHASLETTQRYLGVERRRMVSAVGLLDGAFDDMS